MAGSGLGGASEARASRPPAGEGSWPGPASGQDAAGRTHAPAARVVVERGLAATVRARPDVERCRVVVLQGPKVPGQQQVAAVGTALLVPVPVGGLEIPSE